MTFLQLCQALAAEAGVAGSQNGTVPATVALQTGELGRIVRWVRQAWLDVQADHLWNFLWERPTLTLTAGTNTITNDIPEHRYARDRTVRPVASTDGDWLEFVPWSHFAMVYGDLWLAQNTGVTAWSIRPDNTLVFNGTPAIDQTLLFERYKNPVELVADADVPALPADLHMLIVYTALVKYAGFDEAGAQRLIAQAEVERMTRSLNARCLPTMRMGDPITEDE